MSESAGLDARTLRGLERDLKALRVEFHERLSAEVINETLGTAVTRFSSARIQTYVPILIIRSAREGLIKAEPSRPAPSRLPPVEHEKSLISV